MKPPRFRFPLTAAFAVATVFSSACFGTTISYISGPVSNSSNTISTAAGTFNSNENLGITFTPGGGGPFTINQITLQGFNQTSTLAYTFDFKVEIRGVTSSLPDSTLYASDTVSINVPAISGAVTYTLDELDLVNISNLDFLSGTNYSLVFYNGKVGGANSTAFSIGRNTSATPSNIYTTTNGFAITNTFRNNLLQSTNKYSITLDNVTASPVPEPAAAAAITGAMALGLTLQRRRRTR